MHGLFEAARDAMAKSHSPYSDFPVGAAILTAEGKVYTGANMEVISYPEGWCAETSALAHYVMGGRGTITDIAVVAVKKDRITPCGGVISVCSKSRRMNWNNALSSAPRSWYTRTSAFKKSSSSAPAPKPT